MAPGWPACISTRQHCSSTRRARIVFPFIFSGLNKTQGGGPPYFVAMRRHQTGLHRQLVVRNGYFLSCNGDRLGRQGTTLARVSHGRPPGKRKQHPRPGACRSRRANGKRRPEWPPFVFRRCLKLTLSRVASGDVQAPGRAAPGPSGQRLQVRARSRPRQTRYYSLPRQSRRFP